jgi:hypothetical protein
MALKAKFSGYNRQVQNSSPETWFKIDINTYRHNVGNVIANGTFTAPTDGYYIFGGGYKVAFGGGPPNKIYAGFSVNGSTPTHDARVMTGEGSGTIDNDSSITLTSCLKLSAGDTVEIWAFFGGSSAAISINNYFWGAQTD